MAIATVTHANAEPSKALMRFAEIYSGRLSALPRCEAHASTPKPDGVTVSTVVSLRCAKGALMALGLEAAAAVAALCLYGIWRH